MTNGQNSKPMKTAAVSKLTPERIRPTDRRNWQRQYQRAKALWHYRMVRLDHDDAEALRALATRERTSVAELVRRFVAWGLEEQDAMERGDER